MHPAEEMARRFQADNDCDGDPVRVADGGKSGAIAWDCRKKNLTEGLRLVVYEDSPYVFVMRDDEAGQWTPAPETRQ